MLRWCVVAVWLVGLVALVACSSEDPAPSNATAESMEPTVVGALVPVVDVPPTLSTPEHSHDPGDCGPKPVDKQWLQEREGWTDRQFRNDLNFNSRDVQYEQDRRPGEGEGRQFAVAECVTCWHQEVIPVAERACTGRQGGNSTNIYTSFFKSATHFTRRHWRALEALLYHNPEAHITVLSSSLPADMFAPLVVLGCRVVVEDVNLKSRAVGTPLEDWASRISEWRSLPAYFSHLSTALKLTTLHKSGGVFLDLDVVSTHPLYPLHNVVGRADEGRLADHVLVFDAGSEFVAAAMVDFAQGFGPSVGPSYGAEVLDKAWKEHFNTGPTSAVTVFSPQAFSFFTPSTVASAFEPGRAEHVVDAIKTIGDHAFAVCLWEEVTGGWAVVEGSVAFRLLEQFCVLCDQPLL